MSSHAPMDARTAAGILEFWFAGSPTSPVETSGREAFWFAGGAEQDAVIESRFGAVVEAALSGRLEAWTATPRGRLALTIALDQFPRNLFRGTARAFAGDAAALGHARAALASGELEQLTVPERVFALMPFEHAEDVAAQDTCVAEFSKLHAAFAPEWSEFTAKCIEAAKEHHAIVARFGRFPHRNVALGRDTTADEQAWLDAGAKRFGQ